MTKPKLFWLFNLLGYLDDLDLPKKSELVKFYHKVWRIFWFHCRVLSYWKSQRVQFFFILCISSNSDLNLLWGAKILRKQLKNPPIQIKDLLIWKKACKLHQLSHQWRSFHIWFVVTGDGLFYKRGIKRNFVTIGFRGFSWTLTSWIDWMIKK